MSPVGMHTILEIAAYSIGFRLFLRERQRLSLSALADRDHSLWIGVAAILGAAIGAKLAYWLEDPLHAFAAFPDWRHLLEGKSIVGALLGGLLGVEITKSLIGVRSSSGDAFVPGLLVGIAIGRVGCFLAGLDDHTYGIPTTLPWGVDFGDGVPRHPTQLYEIGFLIALAVLLYRKGRANALPGTRFRQFMLGYLSFRLCVDFIKPMPFVYFGIFSGIQLLCVAGMLYYRRDVVDLLRRGSWAPS
ncbi:MAG: prolipoprotein diacylglyceryl transferase family protein [Tahibacter sp.]